MTDKIYVGTGKIVNTQYGDLPKLKFHKDDINTIVQWMKDNESEWANIDMKPKKEPEEGKPTHYLEVDTWVPEKKTEVNNTPVEANEGNNSDNLPF